eukprot:evm.model.scf_931.5 EVM.evm.TU.scf_931.5   scf_931:34632-42741(-)
MALREHAAYNRGGRFDEALSRCPYDRYVPCRQAVSRLCLRNVDSESSPPRFVSRPSLLARCLSIDTEEGVVNEMLKGHLGEIFDKRQLLTDVSGAGNNWAQGHNHYGPLYRSSISDKIQMCAEECDSLQAFLMLHSLGGGTGSGLGSYILEILEDEYPNIYRFATSVFPSSDDDVVTSPYNSLLSLASLIHHADCVTPVDNEALLDICKMVELKARRGDTLPGSEISGPTSRRTASAEAKKNKGNPFDSMNGIAASLLLNLTSSMRFEGSLNVDLNEITMNLVPFRRLHFLLSSMSPLFGFKDVAKLSGNAIYVKQMFTDIFSESHQVIKANSRHSTVLSCALLLRGDITISDVNQNISRLKRSMRLPLWNVEGFKIGLCTRPPVGVPFAGMRLCNSCGIGTTFSAMLDRYGKLRKGRFYLHHYEQYMDVGGFDEALEAVSGVVAEYAMLDDPAVVETEGRMKPIGSSFL